MIRQKYIGGENPASERSAVSACERRLRRSSACISVLCSDEDVLAVVGCRSIPSSSG